MKFSFNTREDRFNISQEMFAIESTDTGHTAIVIRPEKATTYAISFDNPLDAIEFAKALRAAADDTVMRSEISHGEGEFNSTVDDIPASIVSDLERIDAALDSYDPDNDQIDATKALDALHDARSGLLYLIEYA